MKKIISILMCLVLMFSLSACGRKPETSVSGSDGVFTETVDRDTLDLSGELVIKVMNAGYGQEVFNALKDYYITNVNPDATIRLVFEPNIKETYATEILDVRKNETDLYFGANSDFAQYYMDYDYSSMAGGKSSLLLDLNSFLEFWPAYDEDVMMGKIVNSELKEMLTIADKDPSNKSLTHTFSLAWAAGACGLVYNTEIFEEVPDLNVPTTTDELIATFGIIDAYNKAHPELTPICPVIYADDASEYWQYLTYAWFAQYVGYNNYMNFWRLSDNDPFKPDSDWYRQEGYKFALQEIEKIIKGDHIYSGSVGGLSNKDSFERFVNGDGNYRFAMMPNGDWFQCEAISQVPDGVPDNFAMMKTPKLSKAVLDLGGVENVDDFAYTLAATHNIVVPSYSDKINLALDFISFFFSETGARIFYENTGVFVPRTNHEYLTVRDFNHMTKFSKSEYDIITGGTTFIYAGTQMSPVRYLSGMPVYHGSTPESQMMNNGKTAIEAYDDLISTWDKGWSGWLKDISIEG